jgi:hypothetical protein
MFPLKKMNVGIIILTISVHGRLKTLPQPAGSALVSMSFVDRTFAFEFSLSFASVNSVSVNASLEKA